MSSYKSPSAARMLGVRWAAVSDPGRRKRNEDRFGAWRGDAGIALMVADGMGGHPGGEVAAHMAVDAALKFLRKAGRLPDPGRLLSAISERIFVFGEQHPPYAGLGAAAALAMVRGVKLVHAHAGDVRIFLCRRGELILLTPPHELSAILVREGVLSEEERSTSPIRGTLTSYLGLADAKISTGEILLEPGDRLALVSDGVLEGGVERLLKALSEPDPSRAAHVAVRGFPSEDNATAIVAGIRGMEGPCSES